MTALGVNVWFTDVTIFVVMYGLIVTKYFEFELDSISGASSETRCRTRRLGGWDPPTVVCLPTPAGGSVSLPAVVRSPPARQPSAVLPGAVPGQSSTLPTDCEPVPHLPNFHFQENFKVSLD